MYMKRNEVGYCLFHNCNVARSKVFNKCTARADGKCRYLMIINKQNGGKK